MEVAIYTFMLFIFSLHCLVYSLIVLFFFNPKLPHFLFSLDEFLSFFCACQFVFVCVCACVCALRVLRSKNSSETKNNKMLSLDWWNSDSKIQDETFIQVTKYEQWSVNGINQTSVLSDPVSHMIQVSTLPQTESLEIVLCLNFEIRIRIIEIEQKKVRRGKFWVTWIKING